MGGAWLEGSPGKVNLRPIQKANIKQKNWSASQVIEAPSSASSIVQKEASKHKTLTRGTGSEW
jgi:hypothetical protein